MSTTGTVYLLHFDQPIPKGIRARDGQPLTARHYLGSTSNLDARLAAHESGQGANFTRVVRERGINWTLAATWTGDRVTERYWKNRKNAPRLCPMCRARA